MISFDPLPEYKRKLNFTPASLKILKSCQSSYDERKFLVIYFSNRKCFVRHFLKPEFVEAFKDKFQFLQMCRADKYGNWLSLSYHFTNSPLFGIIDPSNGKFISIHYGNLTTEELSSWLRDFLNKNMKYSLGYFSLSDLIEKIENDKERFRTSGQGKIKIIIKSISGQNTGFYPSKTSSFKFLFDKYCEKLKLDRKKYYFLYHGAQIPESMSPSQFHMKNGDIIYAHSIDEKESDETIDIYISFNNEHNYKYTVQKGRSLKLLTTSFCSEQNIDHDKYLFYYKNEKIDENLTFYELQIENDETIIVQERPQENDKTNKMFKFDLNPFQVSPQTPTVNMMQDMFSTIQTPFYMYSVQSPAMSHTQQYIPFSPFQPSTPKNANHINYMQKQDQNMWDSLE